MSGRIWLSRFSLVDWLVTRLTPFVVPDSDTGPGGDLDPVPCVTYANGFSLTAAYRRLTHVATLGSAAIRWFENLKSFAEHDPASGAGIQLEVQLPVVFILAASNLWSGKYGLS